MTLALVRVAARAGQDDAYGSLVGMAESASSDEGPDAGSMPSDLLNHSDRSAGRSPRSVPETSKAGFGAPAVVRRVDNPVVRAPKREAAKNEGAPLVAVPAAPAPRVWTRLFSSLLPPMTRVSRFEVATSTVALTVQPPHPATAASSAGSAQGLLELVAAATAPSAPTR